MKKILALLLTGTMMFSLAACGSSSKPAEDAAAQVEETAEAAGDAVEEAAADTADAAQEAGEAVEEAATDAADTAGEAVEGAADAAGEAVEGAADAAGEAVEGAAADAAESVEQAEGAATDTQYGNGYVFKHGFDLDYPPYSFIDDNGQTGGFDVEMAQAVCNYYGREY